MNSTCHVNSNAQPFYQAWIDEMLSGLPHSSITRATPSREEWVTRAAELRAALRRVLGFPNDYVPDQPVRWECRGERPGDGFRIEKIVYESERTPPSWVTASLYIPDRQTDRTEPGRYPAMILSCGHGGSKSSLYNQFACQLYARLGCVVLLPDPIGEEERHPSGGMGLRGHREDSYLDRALEAGRPIAGKMTFDLVRGIDLLRAHPMVDPARIGCAGSSLGGTLTQFLAAVDDRLAACVNSAWLADYRLLDGESGCCWRLPGLIQYVNQAEMIALAAPHCAYIAFVGEEDEICPPSGAAEMADAARRVYELFGAGDRFRFVLEPRRGHQPYHLSMTAVEWLVKHLGATPSWSAEAPPPEITLGELAQRYGATIEPLYNVDRHHKGARVVDVGFVRHAPEALRVISDDERTDPARDVYTLEPWLKEVEATLPHSPSAGADEDAVRSWWSAASSRRKALRALLFPERFALEWGPPTPVDLLSLQLEPSVENRAVSPTAPELLPSGTSAFVHALHADFPGAGTLHALVLRRDSEGAGDVAAGTGGTAAGTDDVAADSDGVDARTGVIYLPRSRDWRRADWAKVSAWLARGHAVAVLSCARLYDNELLVGTSATAFNVALVHAARRLLSTGYKANPIVCHGEVDDVAAWAGALDGRIDRVEIAGRGGVEPSVLGTKRKEGVVAGLARVTDKVGLWLCAPDLAYVEGILSESEQVNLTNLFHLCRHIEK